MHTVPYIAFADDDSDDQEMLSDRFLKEHPGTTFKFFKDGQDIIRYLVECPTGELPAVVLVDYKMPIRTGADVLRTLQEDSRYDPIRKIVWSTSGNTQYVSECMKYGAEKYFTKPTDMSELDNIVAQISSILSGSESV